MFWRRNKTKVVNTYCTVSNYATSELQSVLLEYSEHGYKLVSTEIAKDKYGTEVMYLFFTLSYLTRNL